MTYVLDVQMYLDRIAHEGEMIIFPIIMTAKVF